MTLFLKNFRFTKGDSHQSVRLCMMCMYRTCLCLFTVCVYAPAEFLCSMYVQDLSEAQGSTGPPGTGVTGGLEPLSTETSLLPLSVSGK